MREITEGQARRWNLVFGSITSLGLVIAGGLGVVQYIVNQRAEAKKPFYSKQLELCETASNAAAVLATAEQQNEPEFKKAQSDFWRLYWGPLGIVEDENVERAMVAIGECARQGGCQQSPKILSLNLAHACRELISKSWALDLPEIQSRHERPKQ